MSFHQRGTKGADATGGRGGAAATDTGLAATTLVATRRGPVPADRLRPGDAILTRDNGYRALIWAGAGRRGPAQGVVTVEPGRLGPGLPERALHLAPGHGLLVDATALVPVFGTAEAIAPARAFGAMRRGSAVGGLVHLLLGGHELILAEGAWVESLSPAAAFRLFPRRAIAHADRILSGAGVALRPWIEPADLSLPLRAVAPGGRVA